MLKELIITFRPYQWIKNLLVFVPLVFSGKLFSAVQLGQTTLAFVIFCLLASAVYVLNDIADLERDKTHPLKRLRPLAAGKLSPRTALQTSLGMIVLGLAGTLLISTHLTLLMLVYLIINACYSVFLKKTVIIDVFCLGFFYFARVIAGGIAARVEHSEWMLLTVFLLAMLLGFVKRRQDFKLLSKGADAQEKVSSGYNPYFIDQMISILTSSIVVVYLLYTISDRAMSQFGTTHMIYSIPFVYYGIFRYLYLVYVRGDGGDPAQIFFRDRMMQCNLLLWVLVCVGVIYFKI